MFLLFLLCGRGVRGVSVCFFAASRRRGPRPPGRFWSHAMHLCCLLGANPDGEFTYFWTMLSKNRFRAPVFRACPAVPASVQVSPWAGEGAVTQPWCRNVGSLGLDEQQFVFVKRREDAAPKGAALLSSWRALVAFQCLRTSFSREPRRCRKS